MQYIKKQDAISWGILGVIIVITYFFFSDGQFSLIFTLAGTVQAFGFALIVLKIRRSRSVSGLSRETFICYAIIFTIRSIIFIFFKVYRSLCRATYHMILQETLSSKSNKYQLQHSVGTFYMRFLYHSKPVIIKIQTQ